MVRSNEEYLSNSLEYVYKPEIGQRTQYTANTGIAYMTAANANLDGTGTTYQVYRGLLTNGSLIKTITIKAEVTLAKGMVRLFAFDNASTTILISEIEIPARSQTGTQATYAISLEVDFMLKYGWDLLASTEYANAIVVTAEGLDISFP